MYMILFVLDDPHRLDETLAAWEKAGITGVTILESTGINRRRRVSIPMRYLFEGSQAVEEGHVTLLAIVPEIEFVERCLQATEALFGDLDLPNTGVLAAWPLTIVKGVPSQSPPEGE
jgi:nitrogen regulatory protein P-II 1